MKGIRLPLVRTCSSRHLLRLGALGAAAAAAALTLGTMTAPPLAGASSVTGYPVTLTNCGGGPVTFDRVPARVVSTAPNLTEDLLALGLKSRMIGDFGGQLPVSSFASEYRTVPNFSPDAFTLEELVGQHPDLVFSGWGYGFQTGTQLTPQALTAAGIKSLVLTGSCPNDGTTAPSNAAVAKANNIDSTYQDLRNLGKVFNVSQRADTLIAGMQAQVSSAQAKVKGLKPVSVFLYNNGQSAPGTAASLSTPNGLIKLAGGSNIFAGLDQDYTTVSWEQVVNADPQCIIIKNGTNAGNFGTQEEQFLKTSPITANLRAVKNNCFLILNQDELTPGASNAKAVVAIAQWLHPKAFGLRADVS
jgi:iron complex transport system substrate-binding protein